MDSQSPPRLVVLKHVPFEGPAGAARWADSAGFTIETVELSEPAASSSELPALRPSDWLLVMGGPMNVDQDGVYPYLAAEKIYIRRAIEAGNTVIGICLGAQLIARALGAQVYPNSEREIGWLPIELGTPADNEIDRGAFELFKNWPASLEVFHWHGDTFDLPDGAVLIASSSGCRNQAFVYGRRTIGLQFHVETTMESARLLLDNCGEDLNGTGRFVQSAGQIIGSLEQYDKLNSYLFRLLDQLYCRSAE